MFVLARCRNFAQEERGRKRNICLQAKVRLSYSGRDESFCNYGNGVEAEMSGFIIRNARLADRFAVAELWCELMSLHQSLDSRFSIAEEGQKKYARHVQEILRSRDNLVLVAEETASGALVGYILGELQMRSPKVKPGLYAFISDVYVREQWRQQGVGSALFEELRLWCVGRKATAIELYVAENNPAALAFWQAMGLMPFLKLVHLDL